MKKNLTKILSAILIIVLILCLIPHFTKRISVEEKNTNVVVSLYYNDIANRLRGEKLDNAIEDFKKLGVTTISVSEENINSMVARGDVTNIKFNTLRHKYDDESIEMANQIAKEVPEIIYDSQLLITKDKQTADFLEKTLPQRYTFEKEYRKVVNINSTTGIETTIFCIFDGTKPTNDVQLGYNEQKIKEFSDAGFDICLVMRFSDTQETDYIDNIESMVQKYNIKHISIRPATFAPEKEADAKEHYTKISKLIEKYNLTLVVTENANQLSNETPFGYEHIFNNNNNKVMRSYETYDASQDEDTHYKFRYHQYLNSTIDRNIRFITVSQIHLSYKSYEECTELTLKAVGEYIKKIKELGYTVNGNTPDLNYNIDLGIPNAVSTAIMVLMLYLILCIITDKKIKFLFPITLFLAAVGFAGSFIIPESLHWAFPTAWAVLSPCFALSVMLWFVKKYDKKFTTIPLIILSTVVLVGLMSLLGIVQSSLLSGIDYYVNNDIFRGIKLSLFLPLVYALVLYIILFFKIDCKKILNTIVNYRLSDIKIIYIIALLAVLFVGYSIVYIYIRRSGNVNSISSVESAMRNFITDIFRARPRTKEFLVGYPCITLFIYYYKNTKIKILQAVLFCGSAITAASIANSFCHVFTTVDVIYGRVVNGVIIGVVCSVAAYILNLLLVKVVKKLFVKYILPGLSKNKELYSMYKMIVGERN